METLYTPSSMFGRGFKALNTKGEMVDVHFARNKYKIDWKFGMRRGVVTDDFGSKVVVVNPGNGAIFTEQVGDQNAKPVLFSPALYRDGDKSPRKICGFDEDLFVLLKARSKEIGPYTVAKLEVANLSHKKDAVCDGAHFVIYQNGALVSLLANQKTDRLLRKRLVEMGADVSGFSKNIFVKRDLTINSDPIAIGEKSFSLRKSSDGVVCLKQGKERIAQAPTWMEAIASLYQQASSKESFEEAMLPLMAKSLDSLVIKLFGIADYRSIH